MNAKWTYLISIIVWGTMAFLTLYDSEKTQKIVLAYCQKRPFQMKFNPFIKWMHTPAYIKSLKFIGILSCVVLVFNLLFFLVEFTK